MISTTYAMKKGYKPIDFFYRAVVDSKTKKVPFVDAFQILNDRYVGRMNVMNYFFVAENSIRINELNLIALDELKNYHQVMRENFYIPDKLVYSLPLTTRFLGSDRDLEILQAALREGGYKKGSLVLMFNANTLVALPTEAKVRYDRLRRMGYKTCVYGFGEEFNELSLFARYNFDYLRCEAIYFDATAAKKRLLNMLTKFCKANKMGLIMEGVDAPAQATRFRKAGVPLMTGKAVAKLTRWVTYENLNLAPLNDKQKAAYIKKLEAEKAEALRKAEAAREKARIEAIAKAKADAAAGKVVAPEAPKPEIMKSPYQVRLEKQRAAAKRAEEIRAAKKDEKAAIFDVHKEDKDTKVERKLYEDVASSMAKDFNAFGGDDVFGMKLNLGRTAPKFKSKEAKVIVSEAEEEAVPDFDSEKVLAEGKAVKEPFDERKADAEEKARREAELKEKAARVAAKLAARMAKANAEKQTEDADTANTAQTDEIVETANTAETAKTVETTENAQIADVDNLANEEREKAAELAELDAEAPADETAQAEQTDKDETTESVTDETAPKIEDVQTAAIEAMQNGTDSQKADGQKAERQSADGQTQSSDEEGATKNGATQNGDADNQQADDDDVPQGHYNDKHQWVDADGNVYNGYWDEKGNWVDYEEFDELEEGHYNEQGQWVAADGTVYNGYFDEQGRWIDYSYQNAEGEWVDNGYFDQKIGKWVPYGYFDEQGNWHTF